MGAKVFIGDTHDMVQDLSRQRSKRLAAPNIARVI